MNVRKSHQKIVVLSFLKGLNYQRHTKPAKNTKNYEHKAQTNQQTNKPTICLFVLRRYEGRHRPNDRYKHSHT